MSTLYIKNAIRIIIPELFGKSNPEGLKEISDILQIDKNRVELNVELAINKVTHSIKTQKERYDVVEIISDIQGNWAIDIVLERRKVSESEGMNLSLDDVMKVASKFYDTYGSNLEFEPDNIRVVSEPWFTCSDDPSQTNLIE